MKIYFSGSSDDNVEWENDFGRGDEIGAYRRPGWLKVQDPNGDGLMVFAEYAPDKCPDGTWVLGVTLLAENHPLPNWPITLATARNGYSPVLIIDMPEDATITEVPHDRP